MGAAAMRSPTGWPGTSSTASRPEILIVDEKVAFGWGDLMAEAKRRGAGLATMDGPIAATATAHGLTLVTRNVQDFRGLDVELLDPWTA